MRRKTLVAAVCTMAVTPTAAAEAHDAGSWTHKNEYLRGKVIKLHGKRAPGCDLVAGKCRAHPNPGWRKVRRYFNAMRRMVMPVPAASYVNAAPPAQPPAGTLSVSAPAGGHLSSIAQCESGGSPTAVSPSGQYRGKYQFDQQTWNSVGGSGDPAAASEAEQDRRAAILLSQRGSAPWPNCG